MAASRLAQTISSVGDRREGTDKLTITRRSEWRRRTPASLLVNTQQPSVWRAAALPNRLALVRNSACQTVHAALRRANSGASAHTRHY